MQGQLEAAAVDGRRIEPLVDDSGHLLGARFDDPGELALLARLGPGREHARGADHRVQLVAQLVTEVGQDLGIDVDDPGMAVGLVVPRRRAKLAEIVAHQ